MKKLSSIVACILIFSFIMTGCTSKNLQVNEDAYGKYEAEFIGTFDVKTQIIGYSKSEELFTKACNMIYEKMKELHQLYDIYNDYEGIINLKTINDNAGVKPVKVDTQIIELLKVSKDAYQQTNGLTNVAMGAVLRIWHNYRTEGANSPADARLPDVEALEEAAKHTNIDDIIIDEENNTVYLADPEMSLDVGAIAKGYAVDKAKEAAAQAGFESGIIDAGGNVLTVGAPKDGARQHWGIGLQDPHKTVDGTSNIIDTVYLNDMAVVSSGGYQRYYEVDGKSYNHIIDPETLYPADNFSAVTVIAESSTEADYLSTSVFMVSYEKGLEIAETHGVEVIWVYPDGEIKATEGYQEFCHAGI